MNDGDTALVCADEVLVEVAKRNMERDNVVPLYYHMAKAKNVNLSNDEFYNGMISAYSGGNIGAISNDITKIWNSESPNIDAVKYLCMMSNFTIDFAKTLYKPEVPEHVGEMIKKFTRNKTPRFFIYAKDKEEKQVEPWNKSTVNRLEGIIENKRFNWHKVALEEFDFKMLMSDKYAKINQDIVEAYNELKIKAIHSNVEWSEAKGVPYSWIRLREELEEEFNTLEIVDTLVLHLFEKKSQRTKKIFFGVFSDVVLDNLRVNITKPLGEYILCEKCGKRVKKEGTTHTMCGKCSKLTKKQKTKERVRRHRKK